MLCCALIALLSGQPAVFLAAIRARLLTGTSLGFAQFLRTRALGLSLVVTVELTVLGTGGTIGYLGLKQAQQAAALPSGLLHRALCSILNTAEAK